MYRFFLTAVMTSSMFFIATAEAHLLPKQEATLRLDGAKGYLAVAVPAAAFKGVDSNGDGELSPAEIGEHQAEIKQQFANRFNVSAADGKAPLAFVWISNPADSVASRDPHAHTDYIIIMSGAQFKSPPDSIIIETDLFGKAEDELQLKVRARKGEEREIGILTKESPIYQFFKAHE